MLSRRKTVKFAVLGSVALFLGACATVQRSGGFTASQIAALEGAGFERVGENYELGLQNQLLFAVDRADLRPEIVQSLARLAEVLVSVGIGGAVVEGHADATGNEEFNVQLSQLRAEAVKFALAANGISPDRIRTWGAGSSDPIESNETESGRRENRRVVIMVTPGDAAGD